MQQYLGFDSPYNADAQDVEQLAADINNNDQGIMASATSGELYEEGNYAGPFYYYNMLLSIPQADFSETTGMTYLGMDLRQVPNIQDISELSIGDVFVLPESSGAGLVIAVATIMMSKRSRAS
ncbi:MAG TPA: hypothetical protein VHX86_12410 [Tepidisphaeraceae bacterium]|nr:hypothetical protein [Tepidisphaeraceae bacterium]